MRVELARRAAGQALAGSLVVAAFGLAVGALRAAADEPVTVFAAASLGDVLEDLGRRIEAKTGIGVRFSFASSSALARQIEAGAEADIYASADARWMSHLAERGLIDQGSLQTPIGNRLVLITPADSGLEPLDIGPDLDLDRLLGPDGRLAIGNHEHVPAGMYAQEALTGLGLWPAAVPRLALADDVRAALALVGRGEAPLGIVYATDARITDRVRILGVFPEDVHRPIRYPFALVGGSAGKATRMVFEALTGPEARAVYEAAGFTIP